MSPRSLCTHVKKIIEVPMTNIEDELWKLGITMYKMEFMLAVIPNKM